MIIFLPSELSPNRAFSLGLANAPYLETTTTRLKAQTTFVNSCSNVDWKPAKRPLPVASVIVGIFVAFLRVIVTRQKQHNFFQFAAIKGYTVTTWLIVTMRNTATQRFVVSEFNAKTLGEYQIGDDTALRKLGSIPSPEWT
jgi:hypothetical protein